jgi:hypothetical protein
MEDIYWKKLNVFQKIILCFGWCGVANMWFWVALLIHNSITQDKKFWSPKSYRVVYVFGWIYFIAAAIFLTALIIIGTLLITGIIK